MCEADTVEIVFEPGGTDDTLPFEAGYGTDRADTADRCGDTDNGFGLLFNWNLLGAGTHTVRAYADGEEFAHSTVTVTPLAGEFARGLRRTHPIADFPASRPDRRRWSGGRVSRILSLSGWNDAPTPAFGHPSEECWESDRPAPSHSSGGVLRSRGVRHVLPPSERAAGIPEYASHVPG